MIQPSSPEPDDSLADDLSDEDLEWVNHPAFQEDIDAHRNDPPPPPLEPWFQIAAQVAPEPVTWLWRDRIPFGKLTMLEGDPGLGKSTLALDLAARVTSDRPMPDQPNPPPASHTGPETRDQRPETTSQRPATSPAEPARVLVLSAEDGVADTIRPRLEAAGADLRRVIILTRLPPHISAGPLRIPTDLHLLEQAIRTANARLVILDPLVAYLDRSINAHDDGSVRRALHPLAYRAQRTGAAILVIRHLSKHASRNPLYRGGGSIGLIGAVRSALLVAPDPDDPTGQRRILASSKINIGQLPPSLLYRLVPAPNGVAAIQWDGPTHHTATTILAEASLDEASRDALDDARSVLRSILEAGPVPAAEVRQQASRAGLGPALLRRAKAALGVRSLKLGQPGQSNQVWVWSLPNRPAANSERPGHIHGREHIDGSVQGIAGSDEIKPA